MIILRKLAMLVIILLGIIIFLISPLGLNVTLYLASHFLSGKLTYQRASGNLTKSLTLVKLEYKNNRVDIKSDYVQINWHPRKLMHREFAIDTLRAHNVTVELLQHKNQEKKSIQKPRNTSQKSIQFSPLDFSWTVSIGHAMLSNVQFKSDMAQKTINIALVTLQGILNRDNINLQLLVNENVPHQPTSRITLKGSIENYTLAADYQNLLKKQYYTLNAIGDQTHLAVKIQTRSYEANTLNITGEGSLNWQNQFTWNAHIQANALPLLIPKLYPLSRGKFTLILKGMYNGSSINQMLNFSNVTLWLVNGISFNGHAQLIQKSNVFIFNTVLQNANDHLILHGTMNTDLKLTWKLHVDELSDIFMHLNGSVTSNGNITKQSNNSNIQAWLNLSGYSIGDINIDDMNIRIQGSLDRHRITIHSSIGQAKVSSLLIGKAQIQPLSWSGSINQFNISSTNLGSWKLSQTAALSFSPEKIKIHQFQLRSQKKEQLFIDFLWARTQKLLEGKLKFNMDQLPLPFLNITVKSLKANASANGQSANFIINATSLGSPIEWTGSAAWNKTLTLKTHLLGNNILIIDTSEYRITVSPDLMLLLQKNGRVDLTGNIMIPKATIRPDNFISVVSLPSDVEFVGIQEKKPSFFKVYTNINLILGNNISLNTQGIAGNLKGQLTIVRSPDQPFVGNGTLSIVNASYNIFGQKLTITKGRLKFINSTLTNPNLDIQASRSFATSLSSSSFGVQRLTVGANVSGTLKKPQISLFSQPIQLSDVDILSYLLFGSSAGGVAGREGPASNALILFEIANSLKSGKNTGDTNFIQTLQTRLRLTEFGLQTQTDVDAIGNVVSSTEQLVAGAYLSPKLYFRYRYDLFDEENIFEAQYLLNKNWIAQTNTSSSGNGVDILYTIERGQ